VAVRADDVLVPDAGSAATADRYSTAGAAFFFKGFPFFRLFRGMLKDELFMSGLIVSWLSVRGLFMSGFCLRGCRGDHGILHHAGGAVGRFKLKVISRMEDSARR